MRLPSLSLQAILLFATSHIARAVYPDEVGDVDFHYDLLGVAQPSTTFFHRPRKDEKASLLYTLSDVGILGAVNPSNGAVVWRQVVSRNITNGGGFLRAGEGQTWLAGAQGKSVHTWNAFTGRNSWWMDFGGEVKDLEIMELTENGRKDVLALFEENGSLVVRRLNGEEGNVVWEYRHAGHDVPVQVSNNVNKVFAVSLNGSPSSYSLKVSVLDTLTGRRMEDIVIGTKGDVQGQQDIMFVGANSAAPIVAWTDSAKTKLFVNVLGSKAKQELPLAADAVDIDIHAPHLPQSEPHFLVHTRTETGNRADIYHINLKNNDISKAYDLPHLPGLGAFSTSSDAANVYFTRVTEEEILLTSSNSHGVLARWPYKPGTDVESLHAVSEVLKKSGDSYAIRSAVTSTSGSLVLVRNGEVEWTREEGMSGAVAAAWAEIPESEELAKMLEQESHSNPLSAYVHRVNRHLNDLQYLPDYLSSIPRRLISSITGGSDQQTDGLTRDSFGFRKLVILATRRGHLFALDTGNHGKVVWSRKAFDIPEGTSWDVKGVLVNDQKSEVLVKGSRGESIVVKTDTGDVVEVTPPGSHPAVDSAVIVDSPSGPWLLGIGPDGEVGDIGLDWTPKQTIVVRSGDSEVIGIRVSHDGTIAATTISWSFLPPNGQKIVSLTTRPAHDPIASIGRVLGDRKVKYKYLNPNTLLVACLSENGSTLTTYLLDTISGQVLESASHEGVDPTKAIDCVVSENWFACTFFGQYRVRDGSSQSLKGYQLAVTDLFESDVSNDRGYLGHAQNFSSLDPVDFPVPPALPASVSQSWIISAPIDHLAVTQTRQGISRRQLLAYMSESHSVVGLPREIIDPRRPAGRDPTKEEVEAEGLAKYTPSIELDPRAIISHERNIIGVEKIIAAPTIVESTSLIFCFGIDVFGSRVAPSHQFDVLGKEFSKVSLVSTVAALALAVVALRPLVGPPLFFFDYQGAYIFRSAGSELTSDGRLLCSPA